MVLQADFHDDLERSPHLLQVTVAAVGRGLAIVARAILSVRLCGQIFRLQTQLFSARRVVGVSRIVVMDVGQRVARHGFGSLAAESCRSAASCWLSGRLFVDWLSGSRLVDRGFLAGSLPSGALLGG
jgi:hypothetical protein